MLLPTSTGVQCAKHAPSRQANIFQIVSVLTCEPLFLVHRKGSLAFRSFLTVREKPMVEERRAFTLSKDGTSQKSSGAEGTSDFFMAFLICLTTHRGLKFGRPASTMSVSMQPRDTAFASLPSTTSRRTCSQTPVPRHHWTSSCRGFLDSFCFSVTHVVDQCVLCQAFFAW